MEDLFNGILSLLVDFIGLLFSIMFLLVFFCLSSLGDYKRKKRNNDRKYSSNIISTTRYLFIRRRISMCYNFWKERLKRR